MEIAGSRGPGLVGGAHIPHPERTVLSACLGWATAAGWVQAESMDGEKTPADPSSLCALSGGAAGCCCMP